MLFQQKKEKLNVLSLRIRIRIDQAPMSFQEESGKFKIFPIPSKNRTHEAPMLFQQKKEQLNVLSFRIRIRIDQAPMLF